MSWGFFISLATPCRMPINILDYDLSHDVLVTDDRITATSFDTSHPPSQARLSGSGWCSANACNSQPGDVYLQIDFGAELVVEAVAVASNSEGLYVTQYMLEYAGADGMYEYIKDEASNSTVSIHLVIP